MARVKKNKIAAKRRRNVLKLAKGYIFRRSKTEMGAKVAIRKAGTYAFDHRKNKKTDNRRLWTTKLNSFLRENQMTYSVFIKKSTEKKMSVDRKVLVEMIQKDPSSVVEIINSVR